MRILLWHVHGSWTTSFVQGPHTYVLPVSEPRGPDGLGRARTWDWPPSAIEVPLHKLRDEQFDLVILQRPHDYELAVTCTGLLPGVDVPAVYVEHDTPREAVPETPHPFADHPELLIAHVTPFNDLFWDCGTTPTTVVGHGIVDPGYRYTGEDESAGVVVNDPIQRGRVAGTDLLPGFAETLPLEVYGMRVLGLPKHLGLPADQCRVHEDLPQDRMHTQLARSRVYLHPYRWTSLGLSLIEAMHLGMPVVALATTEAHRAVPPAAGTVSTSLPELREALERFRRDPGFAREAGAAARQAALERHNLKQFLENWNHVLEYALEER
jgi:glycosyltransferase involved in cell wall biosynthesis